MRLLKPVDQFRLSHSITDKDLQSPNLFLSDFSVTTNVVLR